MKKLLTTLALVMATQTAYASSISTQIVYDDGSNSSAPITELNFNYESNSTITDSDSNGFLSNNDAISSIGGAELYNDVVGSAFSLSELVAAADDNFISSSTPFSALLGADYGSDWMMTFAINNLMGTFNGVTNVFDYTSGDITVYGLYSSTSNSVWDSFQDLFTISINSTVTVAGNIHYNGAVTGVGSDYFTQTSNGETFGATLANLASTTFVDIEQNAFGSNINPVFGAPGGTQNTGVTGHDGTITFAVPEPTSIAILGLGLLGLAGARRRKS
jgi:hypothetical protein